jgi:hypothetical protein
VQFERTTTLEKALLLFFLAVWMSVNFIRRRRPNQQLFFFYLSNLAMKWLLLHVAEGLKWLKA